MNKEIFRSTDKDESKLTVNEAGGKAYKFEDEHALAQMAMTTFFDDGFYLSAKDQFDSFKNLLNNVDPLFAGKLAVYAHENGKMKDVPVVILAHLMKKETRSIFDSVFPRVITNGKQLCNFAKVVRSGAITQNKSFGTHTKHLIQNWINSRNPNALFKDSIGCSPSLADVIKMTHPRPKDICRENFYAYILGKPVKSYSDLPDFIKSFEDFKTGKTTEVPNIDHRFLTSLELSESQWKIVGLNLPWHALRMNLNTLKRHGCFNDSKYVDKIAKRLVDDFNSDKNKVFPYQIMAAYKASDDLPSPILNALQDVLEKSTANVESFNKNVLIMPDVSGSMGCRLSSKSKMRCIDVAALIASTILKRNANSAVLPFENDVVDVKLNARDSIMTNADKLASIGGGGTYCSAPLSFANKNNYKHNLLIFVSDNESWMDKQSYSTTETKKEWLKYLKRVPNAKMVCIDLQANTTTQILDSKNVMNVGGFSDDIFNVINDFVNGNNVTVNFVEEIKKISLDKNEK